MSGASISPATPTSGCTAAAIPSGAALAEDRRLDPQLEQPVRLVHLEKPAGRDTLAKCPDRDEPRPPPDGELVRRRLVLMGVQGISAVLRQIATLRRVEEEYEQPVTNEPDGHRVESRRRVGPDGRQERGAVRAVEMSSACSGEVGLGGGEVAPGDRRGEEVGRHGPILAQAGPVGKVQFMHIHEVRIALTVDDFDRAVAFYRDALRLPEVEAWDRPDGRGLILDAGRATLEPLFTPLEGAS